MYISLHNHTAYSILDGYQMPKEMVSRVKELGQTAVALTDHGTMRGTVELYRECKAQGIKPIIGCEFYFCPEVSIRDRAFTHHLVLLAMNDVGYRNIKELDTIAYEEDHMFYKPRIDEADLRAHSEGIICLSAWMASIINTDNGEEWFLKFKEIFGDRFFAEIQPLNIDRQWAYNDKVISLARKHGVPLVVTTDAHYARKEDEPYHYLWLQIHGNGYHDDENYLWSEDEIMATPWLPEEVKEEAIANTAKIADMCNVEIEFGGMHYPVYTDRDPEEVITEICRENWRKLVPKGKYQEYAERFKAEMVDLKTTNYLNYLLIIWDLVNWCVKNNIPVGEGRGSAAGCLTGYLMGFHKVDSIKYGTEFFRFCNPQRMSPADIDTDVSTANRGKIIDYIKEHYGTVYKVTTYGYTKNPDKPDVGKQAVLRAQQALEKAEYLALSDDERAEVERRKKAKQDTGMRWTRDRILNVTKELKEDMSEILTVDSDLTTAERERLLDVSQHFAGRIDKLGVHASAILVTPDEVEKYCPVEGCTSTDTSTGKREYCRVAAFEYHTLEDMGLLKLDILGLRTLDIINDCLKEVHKQGIKLDMESIPMNDPATFETYAGGNTTGIFQMESPGMQKVARELHPNRFDDLAALVALYRPGPIDSGMLQQYIDGKNGKIEVSFPCEAVKEIAGNSYGVLLYQEQVMRIAMRMAGYDLGQADGLRKVIGRKELPKIQAAVADFIAACEANGYSHEVASEVAAQIEAAGRYIFNRCISGRERIFRDRKYRYAPTIGEMYRIRHDREYAKKTGHIDLHKKYRNYGYGKAYSLCEDGKLRQNTIVDIRYSGEMPVYVLTTNTGKQVRCTMNHKIPTPNGIKLLEELHVGDEVFTDGGYDKSARKRYNFYEEKQEMNAEKGHCGFTKRPNGNSVVFEEYRESMQQVRPNCFCCGAECLEDNSFEVHHKDFNHANNEISNLVWVCNSCHKKLHYAGGRTRRGNKGRLVNTEVIASIEYECTEDCYDVEMEAPNHTFAVQSGIIVCNSHAVSYAKLSYKTAFLKTHFPAEYMAALLNSRTDHAKLLPYVEEAKRLGIKILPPDVTKRNGGWTVEDGAIRVGLYYIKGVGKNLVIPNEITWESMLMANNKGTVENLVKAGALDCLGKERGWMLSNLQSSKEVLARKEQCQDRIAAYREAAEYATDSKARSKAERMLKQWEAKLDDVEFKESAAEKYDRIAGEISVLSFSFSALPKVLTGTAKSVFEFNDKKGNTMAKVVFSTAYGEFDGIIFASAWKKDKYYDRYRGWQKGINIIKGLTYEFIRSNKGIIIDARQKTA